MTWCGICMLWFVRDRAAVAGDPRPFCRSLTVHGLRSGAAVQQATVVSLDDARACEPEQPLLLMA